MNWRFLSPVMRNFGPILAGALLLSVGAGRANVVLNEVMYHPPDDRDELQFIELHNAGTQPVNLAGWKLAKGVKADLPATVLRPGGLAVVCRNPAAFGAHYGASVPVLGGFSGRLKHGGELVQLVRPDGTIADEVHFDDRAPWPLAPDGDGASLERRTPLAPGNDPANWGSSIVPRTEVAAGSPGQTNSNYSARPLPWIGEVQYAPALPNQAFLVTASVQAPAGITEVVLLWASLTDSSSVQEQVIRLERTVGDATQGTYHGLIPPQPAGRLLRFRVRATAGDGAQRILPDPNDLRPTFSAFVLANTNQALIPEARLLSLGSRERSGTSFRSRNSAQSEPVRGISAFVVLPTNGAPIQTFDHIRLTPRQDGWKVRLLKDQPHLGMTTLNLIHDVRSRWLLSEPLGHELFRRAGVPAPLTGHLRTWMDGRLLGYCLYVEQPNQSFLRRIERDPDGNLYKLLWYEHGLEAQHEKKNHTSSGHADLVEVVEGLGAHRGDAQWAFIEKQFDVEECAGYFAVGQCLQNWDGCFNNYFAYHGPGPEGRWEIFPWDLDKTWGDYDGGSPQYDWYTMPLNFGMNGAKEPASWLARRRHPWGSVEWWRPPGWFSGPLLANPQFRQRFLQRLATLCQTEFTEERFGPVIDDLAAKLEPEVPWRARAIGGDPSWALAEFKADIDSFRRQLKERRAFLLQELRKAGVK